MCGRCFDMNGGIYLCDLFAYSRKIVGDKYHMKDKFFRAFSKDFICRQAEKNPMVCLEYSAVIERLALTAYKTACLSVICVKHM